MVHRNAPDSVALENIIAIAIAPSACTLDVCSDA
jgi:hypothetical protein